MIDKIGTVKSGTNQNETEQTKTNPKQLIDETITKNKSIVAENAEFQLRDMGWNDFPKRTHAVHEAVPCFENVWELPISLIDWSDHA